MDELDQFTHIAAQADAGAVAADLEALPPEQRPEEPPPPPDFEMEAAGAVDMFAAMACGFAPKATVVWTDAAKARTAQALAPVMEKYVFTFGAMPPEIMLAITAGPLLWQTAKCVGQQIEEQKAEAKAKAPPPKTGIERAAQEAQAVPETLVHSQMGLYT